MSDAFLYLGGLALAAYFFRLWLEDYRHNAQQIHRELAAGKTISPEIIHTGLPGSTPASWRVITIALAERNQTDEEQLAVEEQKRKLRGRGRKQNMILGR